MQIAPVESMCRAFTDTALLPYSCVPSASTMSCRTYFKSTSVQYTSMLDRNDLAPVDEQWQPATVFVSAFTDNTRTYPRFYSHELNAYLALEQDGSWSVLSTKEHP